MVALSHDDMATLVAAYEPVHQQIDEIEKALTKFPPAHAKIIHRFVPGLYIREMTVPAGTINTSRIHKTRHPFVISKGRCFIYTPGEGTVEAAAPFCGITEPGTRRIVVTMEELVFTTFHPTDKTDPAEIAEEILFDRENLMLDDEEKARLVKHTK